ncbi:hypothetical protein [Streptomyces sulphureus]|uniref:hypothetical protein n=1 Tax=Streptomyces sulphureus TaxID=47758 RepID=UPI000365DEC0|nr:hypothetical protein [Streptomyces sulphureus]
MDEGAQDGCARWAHGFQATASAHAHSRPSLGVPGGGDEAARVPPQPQLRASAETDAGEIHGRTQHVCAAREFGLALDRVQVQVASPLYRADGRRADLRRPGAVRLRSERYPERGAPTGDIGP